MNPAPALPPDLLCFDRGWLSSSTIICLGDAPAVIDTGYVKDSARTVELAQEALRGGPLTRIAHTHLHSDHCGGTHALQGSWPDAETWVPQASLDAVQNWDQGRLGHHAIGQRCARFRADRGLQAGSTIRLGQREWQVHAAPGHDALALFLFDPAERILVAGDALWAQGVGVIFPEIDGSAAFGAFEDTLRAIEALSPDWVIPGHGQPIARAEGALAGALAQAHARMRHFQQHPERHARYAAQVLIKFHLMDVERTAREQLTEWTLGTPVFARLHARSGSELPAADWVRELVAALVDRGALQTSGALICDA